MQEKHRRQIIYNAARLLANRQETNVHDAKLKAARRLFKGRIKSADMPSDGEIHDEVRRLQSTDSRTLAEQTSAATTVDVIEPGKEIDDDECDENRSELFAVYRSLLRPLESVVPNLRTHPEGDVLYHSLQVFELIKAERPWDEELLLAALLHDVGKAIDPKDHVSSGLEILDGLITDRTAWFIEHHVEARGLLDGTIGARARRRFVNSDDFDDLELFARADRDGCVPGAEVSSLDEALDFIRTCATDL